MKSLVIFILIFAFAFNASAQSKQKVMHVQICLNDIYKEFKSFGKSSLILVKNKYSKGLENLHYGKKKFILKELPISDQNLNLVKSEEKGVIYFTVADYNATVNTAEVLLRIANSDMDYSLIKQKNKWKIKHLSFTVDEVSISPPELPK